MNQQELQKQRNDASSFVKNYHTKRNVIYLNTHNSIQHELTKTRICYELQRQGKHFITEAKLDYGKKGIADILILDTREIIEVMVSETRDQVEYKTKKYPTKYTIIAVNGWEDYFNGNYELIRSEVHKNAMW